ncbi:hypothetical protein AB0G15_40115, partial [Streptosporangium sp. NPDC023825]
YLAAAGVGTLGVIDFDVVDESVESEAVLARWHGRLGGGMVRLAVSRAAPVGGFTGWRPMMPVTIWTAVKPPVPEEKR